MTKALIYQVLPRFWGNGKFSSWKTAEFDYLKSLGVTHIWFTGIIRHASGEPFVKGEPGSPYAISDYYDINLYLAENENCRIDEFEQLLNRAHKAGFKVLIDFVPNHVARNYSDSHGGIPLFDYCDYDWTDTFKINYGDSRTSDVMIDILRFWASKGVDGFRCDMAELVPVEFFSKAVPAIKKEFGDILFVAEVYDRNNYRRYVDDAHFDLLYDKSGVYDTVRAVLCSGASAEELTRNWQWLGTLQGAMLNFIENHDEQRAASQEFLGDPSKAYAAVAFETLFNDASYMLYAGQEVGENAADGCNGRTSIFNFTHVNVMEKRRGNPVLKRYREILSCLALPAFATGGNWDLCYCQSPADAFDHSNHFAFLRYCGDDCRLVFCNFSNVSADVCVRIPAEARDVCHPSVDSIILSVPAFDAAIVRL